MNGPNQIVIPIGLARALDERIENLVGRTATIGYKLPDGSVKTAPLTISGVMTKGFMTNNNSFVGADVAKTIFEDQSVQAGADKFLGFTIQMESSDPEKIAEIKKQLDAKGFEAETVADSRQRTYDAIGIFKTAMNLFAMVALLALERVTVNVSLFSITPSPSRSTLISFVVSPGANWTD